MSELTGSYIIRETLRSRFGLLFFTLLLALVVPALVPQGSVISVLFTAFFTAILFSGLYAVSRERGHFLIGLSIAAPAAILNWWSQISYVLAIDLLGKLLAAVFMAYLAWLILVHIMRSPRVDMNLVYASICIYLLVGFLCGFGFSVIELLNESAIKYAATDVLAGVPAREVRTLYYSFVTLTTLGYGDITPVSAPARVLAMTEALTGQLMLVVLVARLVALHITHTEIATGQG